MSPVTDPKASTAPAKAIKDALSEHAGALRAFVRNRVPSIDVDDVLQLAAMRAIERAASLEDPECVLAWLYRLHRNVITDAMRKRARHTRLVDPVASVPEGKTEQTEPACKCSVFQAGTMNERYSEILRLVDMGDFTLGEAAQLLGVSKNSATVRLHRARKALRNRLHEHCGVTNLRDCASCRCIEDGCCAA